MCEDIHTLKVGSSALHVFEILFDPLLKIKVDFGLKVAMDVTI